MSDNEQQITTMQDLLEDFLCSGNKVKETIVTEQKIFIFSTPISKTKYEELSAYKDKGFNIEKVQNYVKISTANSKTIIFVPYLTYITERTKFYSSKISIQNILGLFTIIGIVALGISYLEILSEFVRLDIKSLFPEVLSNISSYVLIFGTITPYLLCIIVVSCLLHINFANAELYKLNKTQTLKSIFLFFYLPLLTIGLAFPCSYLINHLSNFSFSNSLICFIFFSTSIMFLNINNKKINAYTAINYANLSVLLFSFLLLTLYIIINKIPELHTNFWFTLFVLIIIAIIFPLSTMAFIVDKNFNPNAFQPSNKLLRAILTCTCTLSLLLALSFFIARIFDISDISSSIGIGKYYENIYVNKELSQYKNIIDTLNYNETTNEIRPWVILQTPKLIVISKSKHNQPLYIFHRYPYELISTIPPKNSENIKKNNS